LIVVGYPIIRPPRVSISALGSCSLSNLNFGIPRSVGLLFDLQHHPRQTALYAVFGS
jgi:hypothetical protein